jgi:hypothetical protein
MMSSLTRLAEDKDGAALDHPQCEAKDSFLQTVLWVSTVYAAVTAAFAITICALI